MKSIASITARVGMQTAGSPSPERSSAGATPQQGSQTPGSEPPDRLPDRWVMQLFARFAAIWPHHWPRIVESCGYDALVREWGEALAGLTPQEIRQGIAHCRARHTWTPTPAEFLAAARGDGEETEEQAAFRALAERCQGPALALPARPWSERKAVGLAYLAQIKASLKGGIGPNAAQEALQRAQE